jgi:DNA-binding NarL/FixJ family response regulator
MIDTSMFKANSLISSFFEVVSERFRLTKREREILQLLFLVGASNRELAAALHLLEKTMKNHVANIQRKLNVKSSLEIQTVVYRDKLIPIFINIFQTQENPTKGNREYASISY